MAYYVLDENKNLVQSFDREGFLAILEQAIEQGTLENIDEDSAVASKLRSNINGTAHYIEFVTAAQYSELEAQGALVLGTYYFIIDDTTEEDLETAISGLIETTDSLTDTVGTLVPIVEGKLDEEIYNDDFIIGKDPSTSGGWLGYDTTEEMPFSEGLVLFRIKAKEAGTPSFMPSIMMFISGGTIDDTSAIFPLLISGAISNCYLRANYYASGSKKRLQVCRISDGSTVDCIIDYHRIGDTV